MKEIAPGIFHWATEHPDIHIDVSSHYVAAARVLIDPLEPSEGMGFFDGLAEPPRQVVLTSGLHWRHADRFRDRYGATVRAPAAAAARYRGTDREFEPFDDGDELAPGVTAVKVGGIAPDDFALHIEHGGGALVIADAVIHYGGDIGFVPDNLWGDPRAEQAAVRDALRGLLRLDFEMLLFAHGEPVETGGHAALEAFLG